MKGNNAIPQSQVAAAYKATHNSVIRAKSDHDWQVTVTYQRSTMFHPQMNYETAAFVKLSEQS